MKLTVVLILNHSIKFLGFVVQICILLNRPRILKAFKEKVFKIKGVINPLAYFGPIVEPEIFITFFGSIYTKQILDS